MSKSLQHIKKIGSHFGSNASSDGDAEVATHFPKAALVEFSSNSTNITIQNERGELRSITHKPGLGALDDQGDLDPEIVASTIEFLEDKQFELVDIPHENMRAYGTGSLRDARNSESFQAQVAEQFGLPINVLSGQDEAHNSAIGIQSFFGEDAKGVVWDFGGRSSEFAIIDEQGQITDEVSLQLGSLVLEEYAEGQERLNYIRSELAKLPAAYTENQFENMYVTGGNPRRVIAMSLGEEDYKQAHGKAVPAAEAGAYLDALTADDNYIKVVDDTHFHKLFPKAGLVFQEILQEIHADNLVASNSATRAGAVAQLNMDIQDRMEQGVEFTSGIDNE